MNRPDKAGEQSMEEILASIRQIIADDPLSDQPAPIEVNPLVPRSSSAGGATPTDARAPQLLDRLNGALRNGSMPPTKPLGSKRPLSFDQDLADMFDEDDGAGSASLAAPKPAEIRVPPDLSYPAAAKPANSADGADKSELNGGALNAPVLNGTASFLPPLPFGGADGAAAKEVGSPPPRNFGFPPLRKQGFYPPQNAMPVLPPLPPIEPSSAFEATASAGETPEDALKRISGLGAVVPGQMASNNATPATPPAPTMFGAPYSQPEAATANAPRPTTFSFSAERASPADVEAPTTIPALETPAPFLDSITEPVADAAPTIVKDEATDASPIVPEAKFAGVSFEAEMEPTGPEAEPAIVAPAYEAAPIDVAPDPSPVPAPKAPVAGRPFSNRFAGLAAASPSLPVMELPTTEPNVTEPAPRFAPAPETAAAQALDALAQGLAASAAASAFPGSVASSSSAQPAIPLTPIVEPVPAMPSLNALTPTSGPAAAVTPARTLEDAVADMLRPMLQQWVADNMPRIIEKALRNEVSKTVKPGSKPPGA
jgi:cell pole-organizing protein PopZ